MEERFIEIGKTGRACLLGNHELEFVKFEILVGYPRKDIWRHLEPPGLELMRKD